MKNVSILTFAADNSNYVRVIGKFISIDAMNYKQEIINKECAARANMTMDLTGVTEIDIAGLNTLLQIHRLLCKVDATLKVIVSGEEEVFELLSLTNFDKYLNISIAA